eukprot:2323469-Pyramimonas_sp.AAC.1
MSHALVTSNRSSPYTASSYPDQTTNGKFNNKSSELLDFPGAFALVRTCARKLSTSDRAIEESRLYVSVHFLIYASHSLFCLTTSAYTAEETPNMKLAGIERNAKSEHHETPRRTDEGNVPRLHSLSEFSVEICYGKSETNQRLPLATRLGERAAKADSSYGRGRQTAVVQ